MKIKKSITVLPKFGVLGKKTNSSVTSKFRRLITGVAGLCVATLAGLTSSHADEVSDLVKRQIGFLQRSPAETVSVLQFVSGYSAIGMDPSVYVELSDGLDTNLRVKLMNNGVRVGNTLVLTGVTADGINSAVDFKSEDPNSAELSSKERTRHIGITAAKARENNYPVAGMYERSGGEVLYVQTPYNIWTLSSDPQDYTLPFAEVRILIETMDLWLAQNPQRPLIINFQIFGGGELSLKTWVHFMIQMSLWRKKNKRTAHKIEVIVDFANGVGIKNPDKDLFGIEASDFITRALQLHPEMRKQVEGLVQVRASHAANPEQVLPLRSFYRQSYGWMNDVRRKFTEALRVNAGKFDHPGVPSRATQLFFCKFSTPLYSTS